MDYLTASETTATGWLHLVLFLGGLSLFLHLAITLHELGHFLVGRLLGLKFTAFDVGNGPRLFERRWRGINVRYRMVPWQG